MTLVLHEPAFLSCPEFPLPYTSVIKYRVLIFFLITRLESSRATHLIVLITHT